MPPRVMRDSWHDQEDRGFKPRKAQFTPVTPSVPQVMRGPNQPDQSRRGSSGRDNGSAYDSVPDRPAKKMKPSHGDPLGPVVNPSERPYRNGKPGAGIIMRKYQKDR